MPKFKVEITRTQLATFVVEADSELDADLMAMTLVKLVESGEVTPRWHDGDVDFEDSSSEPVHPTTIVTPTPADLKKFVD